eukprot:6478626-Heterocapsa_arctica.AAC.1
MAVRGSVRPLLIGFPVPCLGNSAPAGQDTYPVENLLRYTNLNNFWEIHDLQTMPRLNQFAGWPSRGKRF